MTKVERIERTSPPKGPPSKVFVTSHGFQMADPSIGKNRHHSEHAIYVRTLDEVDLNLKKGYYLWMKQEGKRQTLISPGSLRVIYK